jgi:hypothetical protein
VKKRFAFFVCRVVFWFKSKRRRGGIAGTGGAGFAATRAGSYASTGCTCAGAASASKPKKSVSGNIIEKRKTGGVWKKWMFSRTR